MVILSEIRTEDSVGYISFWQWNIITQSIDGKQVLCIWYEVSIVSPYFILTSKDENNHLCLPVYTVNNDLRKVVWNINQTRERHSDEIQSFSKEIDVLKACC